MLASRTHADGKLDRARDEIRGDDRADAGDSDDSSWIADLISGFLDALFEDDDDASEHEPDADAEESPRHTVPEPSAAFEYSRYPYENARAHYIVPLDRELAAADVTRTRSDVERALWVPSRGQPFAGQVALEGGHLDGLSRGGLSLRLLTPSRLELDARAAWLSEPASAVNSASTGDAHASVRFAQSHALLLRLGVGVRYWADSELTDAGLDALLGIDAFPAQPFVVSAQLGGGHLGQAPVGNARLQLGVALARFELFAGFEWLRIGDVDLGTPFGGLRVWL